VTFGQIILLLLLSYLLAGTALIPGVALLLLFVLRLEPDSSGGQIIESVGVGREQPFNLEHHATYIRFALHLEDGGEMAADVRF